MNREMTNRIRFVLEDLLPPALRDSPAFRWLLRVAWGPYVDTFARFRERAPFLSREEYNALYANYPHVHDHTDNSEACIRRIIDDVVGETLCDVGCGTGALLSRIKLAHPGVKLVGVDVQLAEVPLTSEIEFREGSAENLPFPDRSFDTVICTHVIEHLLDYRAAIKELRRIAKRRLIIVVPREREYRYTFNPHFHFFPYVHSFERAMHPIPPGYLCEDVKRDIYYMEDVA
jgi:SAM-dependent methyltransferase